MPSSPVIPLEVIQAVIDILAQDDNDFSSLKSCSLVCQTFLHLCRKHIFAFIFLDGRKWTIASPATVALIRLLSATPEIADHIRKLVCFISSSEFEQRLLPGTLKRINKLEHLSIFWPRFERRWNNNLLRSAMLHLLHLPTLVHLELRDIQDFVVLDIVPCINLKKLELTRVKTAESEAALPCTLPSGPIRLHQLSIGIESSMAVLDLCKKRRPDSKSVIDLTNLASIEFILCGRDEFDAAQEFFKYCERLTEVDIFIYSPPFTWAGLSKMLHPSIQTLTHLRLKTMLNDESGTGDPLSGLVAELEQFRHQNQIENIAIRVSVEKDTECNRGEWGRLDEEMTRSGWPKLKSVSLCIVIWRASREDNDLELALKKLPETQFPRLSSSKSVVFEFEVINEIV